MTNLLKSFDLTGHIAVVTGGAGLLGAEFCSTLAEAGAQVVVADANQSAACDLVADLNNRFPTSQTQGVGDRALAIKTDVSKVDSVHQMVSTTLETYGRLDILVNGAAMDPKVDPKHASTSVQLLSSFEDYPLEMWNQTLEVNLTGMFLCCQAAVRPMLAQGKGVIVNVCSIYGLVGPDQRIYQKPGQQPQYKPADYSVTKAGVLGLTRYLAAYYVGKNIRVNALTPGGIYNGHDEIFVQSYSARAILGRMAEKSEMNGAILFLASEASAYMTGANLVVDGGWTVW